MHMHMYFHVTCARELWISNAAAGILKYELHPYLAAGHVREGSYVELSKYELAAARRLNGDGSV